MVKPEWGAKRSCPKCSTRFYDLGKDEPVTCIECGHAWSPEPVLKSKQPLPFEIAQPDKAKADEDLGAEDLVPSLIAFARERLADYKVPQFVRVIGDGLPRNAGGKVLKTTLRKEYGGQDKAIKR